MTVQLTFRVALYSLDEARVVASDDLLTVQTPSVTLVLRCALGVFLALALSLSFSLSRSLSDMRCHAAKGKRCAFLLCLTENAPSQVQRSCVNGHFWCEECA